MRLIIVVDCRLSLDALKLFLQSYLRGGLSSARQYKSALNDDRFVHVRFNMADWGNLSGQIFYLRYMPSSKLVHIYCAINIAFGFRHSVTEMYLKVPQCSCIHLRFLLFSCISAWNRLLNPKAITTPFSRCGGLSSDIR